MKVACVECGLAVEVFDGAKDLCLGHHLMAQDGELHLTAEQVVFAFRTPGVIGQRVQGGKKR